MASSAVRLGSGSASGAAPAVAATLSAAAGSAPLFAALLRFLGGDRAGVWYGRALALHPFDLREHLVERGLHGFGCLRGQVREVALGSGARDLEPRHIRAHATRDPHAPPGSPLRAHRRSHGPP